MSISGNELNIARPVQEIDFGKLTILTHPFIVEREFKVSFPLNRTNDVGAIFERRANVDRTIAILSVSEIQTKEGARTLITYHAL